jgi:hypothetical protein
MKGVVLPAPVTEKIVLHPSAHSPEAPVGDPDDVKRVGHTHRVIEMGLRPARRVPSTAPTFWAAARWNPPTPLQALG